MIKFGWTRIFLNILAVLSDDANAKSLAIESEDLKLEWKSKKYDISQDNQQPTTDKILKDFSDCRDKEDLQGIDFYP